MKDLISMKHCFQVEKLQDNSYLGDGEVHANNDDDKQKEQVKGTNDKERLLKQQQLLESVADLQTQVSTY